MDTLLLSWLTDAERLLTWDELRRLAAGKGIAEDELHAILSA